MTTPPANLPSIGDDVVTLNPIKDNDVLSYENTV